MKKKSFYDAEFTITTKSYVTPKQHSTNYNNKPGHCVQMPRIMEIVIGF